MRKPISTGLTVSRGRPGFSLVEVVISTLLVGLMLVAAMRSVGASIRAGMSTANRGKALMLAEDLMSEILQTEYIEPVETAVFGMETSETGGTREFFDDADDYDDWDASPPQAKDGTAIPDLNGWRRKVFVYHLDPDNLQTSLADNDDQGVKWIQVIIESNSQELANISVIQTTAWINMIPQPGNDQTTGSMPSGN